MRSVRLGDVLEWFLVSQQFDSCRWVEELTGAWEELVGPELAACSYPLLLEESRLTVAVPDTTAASEVSFSRARIQAAVNRFLGEERVQEIRVRVLPPRPQTAALESADSPPVRTPDRRNQT